MIRRFFNGFGFIFRGRMVLQTVPGIRVWIIFPFIIQISLLGIGLYFGLSQLQTLLMTVTSYIVTDTTGVLGALLFGFLYFVSAIIFAVMYFYFVYMISQIIASPFYSVITEKTLTHYGLIKGVKTLRQQIAVAWRMFFASMLRGALFMGIGVLLFVLSFIPVLNFIAAFIVFLILALDSADFSFETMEFPLAKRWTFFKENFIEFVGMGTFVGLTAVIPGLILFVMPLAVLGTTEFVAQKLTAKKLDA